MPIEDREVAGIRCREVLANLSDYLDGELDAGMVAKIHQHLDGCDWCERFGSEFTEAVNALRGPAVQRPANTMDPALLQTIRDSIAG